MNKTVQRFNAKSESERDMRLYCFVCFCLFFFIRTSLNIQQLQKQTDYSVQYLYIWKRT